MAITKVSNTAVGRGFSVNATSADLSGCEELVAAPAAGVSIHLTQLSINTVSAITVTIGAGETAGAVTTVLYGPVNFAVGTPGQVREIFNPPIEVAAATSLTVDASAAGLTHVYAQGYIE